jgi:hypothetical protein
MSKIGLFALVECVRASCGFLRAGAIVIDLHNAGRVNTICDSGLVILNLKLVLAQKVGHLLAEHTLVHLGHIVKVGHFFARARIEYGNERIRGDVVIVNELLAIDRVEIDLEEDKVGFDNLLDRVVTPKVPVQALACKVSLILNIQ